jgi:hypothetical protein
MGTVHQRRRSGEAGLDILRRANAIEIVRGERCREVGVSFD